LLGFVFAQLSQEWLDHWTATAEMLPTTGISRNTEKPCDMAVWCVICGCSCCRGFYRKWFL